MVDASRTAEASSLTDRPCPRCACPLFEGRLSGAALLGCGRCGGVWLNHDALRLVLRGHAPDHVALAEQVSRAASVTADDGGAPCPVCGRIMVRADATPSTAVVDQCAKHGTWFDRNELRIVALAHANLPKALTFNAAEYPTRDEEARARLPWWLRGTDHEWGTSEYDRRQRAEAFDEVASFFLDVVEAVGK